MTQLAGKTVVVTGASRGLGALLAKTLARHQARVVGVARSQSALEAVCTEIVEAGGQAIALPFDLSQSDRLPLLLQQIEAAAGPVDVLINNAGLEHYRAFQDCTLADIQSVLSVNLVAAMELTRLVLPACLERRSGHIVNITSLAGKKGHPYDSAYSASKAGLLMWGHALRQELAGTGVHISAVCPGYVGDLGLLADSQVPAPPWAGVSTAEAVVAAVVRAIQHNQAEVLINQGPLPLFSVLTRLLLATEQLFPTFPDITNRWLGVTRLNRQRIAPQPPVRVLMHR